MSWDLMVFNYRGSPPRDFSHLPSGHEPDPLGSADDVRESISEQLPGIDWSDPTWGIYHGNGFSIEFNTSNDDPLNSIMLHVRGEGEAIPTILLFATANNWSLFDCSTSKFLDPEDPSNEGWQHYQTFRDQSPT